MKTNRVTALLTAVVVACGALALTVLVAPRLIERWIPSRAQAG